AFTELQQLAQDAHERVEAARPRLMHRALDEAAALAAESRALASDWAAKGAHQRVAALDAALESLADFRSRLVALSARGERVAADAALFGVTLSPPAALQPLRRSLDHAHAVYS
ncbi:MAG: hypothetical protein ACK4ZJ_16325, partial [Allorhizobium sp.]